MTLDEKNLNTLHLKSKNLLNFQPSVKKKFLISNLNKKFKHFQPLKAALMKEPSAVSRREKETVVELSRNKVAENQS